MATRTYMIQIDEDQRQIIEEALGLVVETALHHPEPLDDVTGLPPIQTLHEMFRNLPVDDDGTGKLLHGFCL